MVTVAKINEHIGALINGHVQLLVKRHRYSIIDYFDELSINLKSLYILNLRYVVHFAVIICISSSVAVVAISHGSFASVGSIGIY